MCIHKCGSVYTSSFVSTDKSCGFSMKFVHKLGHVLKSGGEGWGEMRELFEKKRDIRGRVQNRDRGSKKIVWTMINHKNGLRDPWNDTTFQCLPACDKITRSPKLHRFF